MKATARSIGTTSVPKVMVTPDSGAPPAAEVPPVAAPAAEVPPSDVPPPVIVAPPTAGAPPVAGLPAIGTLAAPADVTGVAPPHPKLQLVSTGGASFECSATPQAPIPTTHSPVSSTLARSLLMRAIIIGLPPNWPKVGLPRRRKDRFAAHAANSEHPRSARRAV